jgi:hypothetical protein
MISGAIPFAWFAVVETAKQFTNHDEVRAGENPWLKRTGGFETRPRDGWS